MSALAALPTSKAGADNWPKGWWIASAWYACCGSKRGHRIRTGERIYLTGLPGEMFCAKHAPECAQEVRR